MENKGKNEREDLKITENLKSHPMDFYPVDMGAVRRAVFVSTIISNGNLHDDEVDKGRS
jgi:hypothetical protein